MSESTLMNKSIAEMVGTAFFTFGVLSATQSWAVAVALLASIIVVQAVGSGANLNPAISTAMYMQGKLNGRSFVHYVIAQLIGAAIGVALYCWVNNQKMNWFKELPATSE